MTMHAAEHEPPETRAISGKARNTAAIGRTGKLETFQTVAEMLVVVRLD